MWSILSVAGCSYPLTTFPLNYSPGLSYSYEYVTQTILNEASDQIITTSHQQQQQTGAGRDVGFRLTARVDVTPVWQSNGVMVVKLEVRPSLFQPFYCSFCISLCLVFEAIMCVYCFNCMCIVLMSFCIVVLLVNVRLSLTYLCPRNTLPANTC